jgi:hypothetical protein
MLLCSLLRREVSSSLAWIPPAADEALIAGGVLGELAAEGTAACLGVAERLAVGVDVRRVGG